MSLDFHALLLQSAKEEGFLLAGALDLDSVLVPKPFSGQADFSAHVERYDRWLAQGYEGAMQYLRRGRDRRADPRLLFPAAQSILCVAIPYPASPAGNFDPTSGPRYARYLKRQDYHEDICARLERTMQRVRLKWENSAGVTTSTSPRELHWKVCVDHSAVLERSWAVLAGLGWIGKNTLLIHPQHGSYLFLGEVLISEKTGHGPTPLKNYCGNCTRCLEGCPTGAIREAGVMDSNECIAYWTLEKRGELTISEKKKTAVGTWIAGCDICQEVCPFNTKPSKAAQNEDLEFSVIANDGATRLKEWRELLEETPEQYKLRIKDSALSRVKPAQFSRNLAIALTNAIAQDPHSLWFHELRPLIEKRLEQEKDPAAKMEWTRCDAQLPNRSP